MKNLFDTLKEYCGSDSYPFHMPGHKRRMSELFEGVTPFELDITEIDGFDNLHHAEGILKEAQRRAAEVFGAEETHYLVNGSTGGILSAVSACTTARGKLLIARNCHKAVYHAAQILGLSIRYLYPTALTKDGFVLNGVIHPADVKEALEKEPDIQAVLLTSPTYDGIVSDIEEIVKIAHRAGVPLIVDEAHGAHFGFHPMFPARANTNGADIVINSLHKTLPSMTQTALLHVNGSLVDREKLREYLGIYQTSSPSYVMMAGMDRCVCLLKKRSAQIFDAFAENLREFYEAADRLSHVKVLDLRNSSVTADPSKLLIRMDGKSGRELAQILRTRYHLEVEMETEGYVLALTSVGDTREGFCRLLAALEELNQEAEHIQVHEKMPEVSESPFLKIPNRQELSIMEAKERMGRAVPLEDSAGSVSREYCYLYPPGIPLLVPGEVIGEELLETLLRYRRSGMSLQGMKDYSGETIEVVL